MSRCAAALTVLLLACPSTIAAQTAGSYEVIANAFGFSAFIPGALDASKNIREIAIDELNIDVREMTTGHDVEYRLYGPGHAHWGSASFTSACTLGASKELQAWWKDASKSRGKDIRKNITVTLHKSDKSAGRVYTLVEAEPVSFTDCDPRMPDSVVTIVVSPSRIDFESPDDKPAKPGKAVGIEIHSPGTRTTASDAWDLVTGGAPSHENPPLVLGTADGSAPVDGKAHSTCTPLTMQGPMTSSRKAMMTWITETVQGKPWKRTLHITTHTAAVFSDGFPVRYVFPRMSVTNTTGNTMEEVTLKFIRCELK